MKAENVPDDSPHSIEINVKTKSFVHVHVCGFVNVGIVSSSRPLSTRLCVCVFFSVSFSDLFYLSMSHALSHSEIANIWKVIFQ